ncbi:MAG: sugar phosphate nucleotidyltransferase [Solirubrobacterales bacterium]
MQAVILAGGKGTRLRPYTTILPKPLMPLGNQPILELILHQLSAAGFREVDLSVGHLGGLIRAYLTESEALGDELEVRYIYEDEPLGTAGALKLIDPAPREPFLVMNGDILTTLDYAELMRFHRSEAPALTIASHQKEVQLALGVIETGGEGGEVTGFVEKPTLHYEVSMGIYIYDPAALSYIPEGRFDFPDVVMALLEAGEKVVTYPFEGEWFDIGTRDEHERAMVEFDAHAARFGPEAAE